jgi:hypothetical protein
MRDGCLFRYENESDPKFQKRVFVLENEIAGYEKVSYALANSFGTSALLEIPVP